MLKNIARSEWPVRDLGNGVFNMTMKRTKSFCRRCFYSLVSTLAGLTLSVGASLAQAPFYQGKTITYTVGLLAGDSTDLWSRALTRNMITHIPGNPSVVVQNMPGAGGLIAANYVYIVWRSRMA